MKNCKLRNQRPKAFWGALLGGLVPSLFGFTGSLISAKQQADALKRQQEEQRKLAIQQNEVLQQNSMAASLNNYANTQNLIEEEDKYLGQYKNGGKINSNGVKVLAGGKQIRLNNRLSLLRGNFHGQRNKLGGDGITMKFRDKEVDAENGEAIWDISPSSKYIFSNSPELGIDGISPAQLAILTNKPKLVANIAETNKARLGIKSSPVGKRWGDYIGTPEYINLGGDILGAFGNLASNWMLNGININPVLANYTDVSSVSIPTKVKSWGKYRSLARAANNSMRDISRNIASSNAANSLRQRVATNEAEEFAKVYDDDYVKTLDNIKFNAQNEQQTRLANQQARQQINLANQQVQMDAIKANTDIAMQRARNVGSFIADLGKGAVNLGNQYIQNRNDLDSLKAYLSPLSNEAIDRFFSLRPSFSNRLLRNWKKYKATKPTNTSITNPYSIESRLDGWGVV